MTKLQVCFVQASFLQGHDKLKKNINKKIIIITTNKQRNKQINNDNNNNNFEPLSHEWTKEGFFFKC